MSDPRKLTVDKSFYVTGRVDGHSNWQLATWRELFQNSVDAGAKRIDIDIDVAAGRGSFGRPATLDQVLRINFRDDGAGMTQDILENVFFRPGESSKKDETTTGGFGTARLMLCFSQVRYGIRTNDLVVEGDGGEFTSMTRAEALPVLQEEVRKAVGQAQFSSLQEALRNLETEPFIKGAWFQIDMDPKEERSYPKPTRSYMTQMLEDYLSMSQIPCKVYLGGEEMTQRSARGPSRRTLVAKVRDQEVPFATAHVSKSESSRYKGKVLVRCNGSLMHVKSNYNASGSQIIIEIDPKIARQVLTDNRDGVRGPYSQAIEDFQNELAIDNKSAMRDQSTRRHTLIRGKLGTLSLRIRNDLASQQGAGTPAGDGHVINPDAFRSVRVAAGEVTPLTPDQIIKIMVDVYGRRNEGFPTFYDEYPNQFHVTAAQEIILDRDRIAEIRKYEEFFKFAVGRITAVGGEPIPNLVPISGLNDVHIQTNDPPEKIRKVIFKYYPYNWRKASDKPAQGVYAHSLLSAWNVAAQHASNALFSLLPPGSVELPLRIETGFYFSKSEEIRMGNTYMNYRAGAVHQGIGKLHLLLINPVFADGTAAFDLGQDTSESSDWGTDEKKRNKQGLQKIAALAIHEVVHIVETNHNESFSSIMTEIQASVQIDQMLEDMRDAIAQTRQLYLKPVNLPVEIKTPEPAARGQMSMSW